MSPPAAHLRWLREYTASVWDRCRSPEASEDGPCWEWLGLKTINGYGSGCKVDWTPTRIVSRQVWTLLNGPIAGDLFVCHRCDNRVCYRPSHLFLGTRADNMRDMVSKGRSYSTANERSHVRRYSNAEIAEWRRLHALGMSTRQVATRVGASKSHVATVVQGKGRLLEVAS